MSRRMPPRLTSHSQRRAMADEVPTVRVVGRSRTGPTPLPSPKGGREAMPEMPPSPPDRAVGPAGKVPPLPSPRRLPAEQQGGGGISPRAPSGIRPASEALAVALAPLAYGEGFRLGLLGDSGCGKSWLARAIVLEYLRRSPGIVGVANSKADPWPTSKPWPAESHREPYDLVGRPPIGRVVVFTPDSFGASLSLEDIAVWQWRLARKGWPSLTVYDEISDATKKGERRNDWIIAGDAAQLPRVFTHGRRPKISGVWGAQFAHQVPMEPWEESPVVFCWHQAGNALGILGRRHYLEGVGVEEAIRALPSSQVPPNERGAFVMLRRSQPWDGRVYRL